MICEDVNRSGAASLLMNNGRCCADDQHPKMMTRAQMVCEDVNYDAAANAGGGGGGGGVQRGAEQQHNAPPEEAYALMELGGSLFCVPASALVTAVGLPLQSQVWQNPQLPLAFSDALPEPRECCDALDGPRLPVSGWKGAGAMI